MLLNPHNEKKQPRFRLDFLQGKGIYAVNENELLTFRFYRAKWSYLLE